ncbi:MAG: hypothetical protein E7587_02105 [Ruminococcaceae bacterium]|nr:hypothetical protein [Oscillospiraceae bacterium]
MEQNYDFRQRMCEVHRPAIFCEEAYHTYDGLRLDDSFSVLISPSAGEVARIAAEDFCDYLFVSHGLKISVTSAHTGGRCIRFLNSEHEKRLAPSGKEERAYRINVTEQGVDICANSEKGIFAATVYLEELMSEAGCPALPYGDIDRRPLFSPRMVHSGYEIDVFPDEYLNRIAHDGYDTLLVFVKGVNLSTRGECDFNDICRRAARYGLDVYAYSYIVSEKNPLDEGAEEYYSNTYGALFRSCPGFRGVVFVGESCEFPSRDPRVMPWLSRYNRNSDGTLRSNLPSSAGFPASDYPDWLNFVKRIIRKESPDADIIFWTYNWGYRSAEERIPLIENLPLDVSLQATFEMFETLKTPENVHEFIADYSLSIPGPGVYFRSEAEAAAKRGLRLYTMSNTAGRTWDLGIVPYIPAPGVWCERYDALIDCHERYGLSGLMECHHYGAYHSFISELTKEMGWAPRRDPSEHLAAIGAREFGKENVAKALEAWKYASEGIRHCMPTGEDQYGPLRVGPAYPFFTKTIWRMPSLPTAHFGGGICVTSYGVYPQWPKLKVFENYRNVLYEIEEFTKMRDCYDKAAALFKEIAESLSNRRRTEAGRQAALLYLMARTAETTVNVKRFTMLREMIMELAGEQPRVLIDSDEWLSEALKLYGVDELTPSLMYSLCETIADEECDNALRTIPAVEYDSALGYEPSMEYMCDREHLLWKIERTKDALSELAEVFSRLNG